MAASTPGSHAGPHQQMSSALTRLGMESGATSRPGFGKGDEFNTELFGAGGAKAAAAMVQTFRKLGLIEGESQVDQLAPFTMPKAGSSVNIGNNVSVSAEEFGPSVLIRVSLTTPPSAELASKIEGAAHRINMEDTAARQRF